MTTTVNGHIPQAVTSRPDEFHHGATIAFLVSGGGISTNRPDSLRRELTRLELPFATSDDGAYGTTFKLIRPGSVVREDRLDRLFGSPAYLALSHR